MHEQDRFTGIACIDPDFTNVNLDASIAGRKQVFSMDWSRRRLDRWLDGTRI